MTTDTAVVTGATFSKPIAAAALDDLFRYVLVALCAAVGVGFLLAAVVDATRDAVGYFTRRPRR